MSKAPSTRLAVVAALLSVLSACAGSGRRAEFSAGYPVIDCPEHLAGRVGVTINVYPADIEASSIKAHSVSTTGAVGRRVHVSVVPNGLHQSDRIIWSSLSFTPFGGTFVTWSQLQTSQLTLAPTASALLRTPPDGDEHAAVSIGPGQVSIVRSARGKANLLGASSLDVLIMPGGVAVDDTVLRISNLWSQDGRPSTADEVVIEALPIRHPPGLDTVQAAFDFTYVVREGQSGDEWTCATEGRATLVDHDAVRQPFWDLGLARANAERKEWLALLAPSIGALRAVFDSPERANALATWIQTTGSLQIGEYRLGVFTQSAAREGRPFAYLDADSISSLRSLTASDLPNIRVGAAGER